MPEAIAACFVFRREISCKAVWDFFDNVGANTRSDRRIRPRSRARGALRAILSRNRHLYAPARQLNEMFSE
jgi:hypothetical protein